MSTLKVIHTPNGLEHPYEQLPEERFPRQPLAGETFTIGIATRPADTAAQVRVHYILGDAAPQTIMAQRIDNWQPELEDGVGAEYLERIVRVEQDVWRAQLTAPPTGQTLTYWIEADGVPSERFTVVGESWSKGGGLIDSENGAICLSRDGDGMRAPGLPEIINLEWLTGGQRARRVRLTVVCAPHDGFYALGERFNALNQRGEVMDVRCYEQYKSQGKRTYMPVPFLLVWSAQTGSGYGLHVESSRWMQFDLAAAQPDRWTLEADLGPDETLRLIPYHGDSPFAITGQFAQATGPVALPPQWAFGLWMSANEWNSQSRVLHEVEQSMKHDIQPSVLVIEAWSDETTFYIWNDAQYTPRAGDHVPRYADFTFPPDGKWPDPKNMVDALHENGIKLLLWQIPVLKAIDEAHAQHDVDRAHYEASGFGVREADGSLHRVRPFWFRGGAIWDVTNPAEREWWLGKRAYLLEDLGIDGFKTDGGEHLWSEQVVFADGRTSAEVWNEYAQRYSEAYYQYANQRREAITFSRSGFTGSQRAPLHWAGDENSTWDAYRHSILAGLSAGLSGIPFWGWDIAGFSGPLPTAELYLRATAMAAFCPVFQYHAEYNAHREPSNDRTPWNMQARTGDDRVIDTFRHFTNVRHNLMPYIWQEAQFSAESGQPMMRALVLTEAEASPYQYMFGRDLLVCPVVEPDVTRWTVYLPEGTWTDLWTGETHHGGQQIACPAPIDRIPVFVRAGASIPVALGPDGRLGESVPMSAPASGQIRGT